jgi:hypothetical protein
MAYNIIRGDEKFNRCQGITDITGPADSFVSTASDLSRH